MVNEQRMKTLASRWSRLELIRFQAHESFKTSPAWGAWYLKVRERVGHRQHQIIRAFPDEAPTRQAMWRDETPSPYTVQAAVMLGNEFDPLDFPEDRLEPEILSAVWSWDPMPNVRGESDAGCGILIFPIDDEAVVESKLQTFDIDATFTDITDMCAMPAVLERHGAKQGHRLYGAEQQRVRLKTP